MAKIANTAYFPAGTILIGVDDYAAHIPGCTLTPKTPTTTIIGIDNVPQVVAGAPVWELGIDVTQDLTTASSLSQYLIANAGTKKTVVFTPKTGGKGFTITALIIPAAVGGKGGAVAMSSVTLPCDGQPVIA